MTSTRTYRLTLWLITGLLVVSAGCGPKEPPPIVVIEGTLTLNGVPLPLALVEFMPELKGFGAEMNSNAVTDANGKFKLVRGAEPGAVIASHHVVVNEGPPPDGTRGQDGASQAKLTEYVNQLKNRPIPAMYGNYSATPLRIEVKEDKRDLVIELKR